MPGNLDLGEQNSGLLHGEDVFRKVAPGAEDLHVVPRVSRSSSAWCHSVDARVVDTDGTMRSLRVVRVYLGGLDATQLAAKLRILGCNLAHVVVENRRSRSHLLRGDPAGASLGASSKPFPLSSESLRRQCKGRRRYIRKGDVHLGGVGCLEALDFLPSIVGEGVLGGELPDMLDRLLGKTLDEEGALPFVEVLRQLVESKPSSVLCLIEQTSSKLSELHVGVTLCERRSSSSPWSVEKSGGERGKNLEGLDALGSALLLGNLLMLGPPEGKRRHKRTERSAHLAHGSFHRMMSLWEVLADLARTEHHLGQPGTNQPRSSAASTHASLMAFDRH